MRGSLWAAPLLNLATDFESSADPDPDVNIYGQTDTPNHRPAELGSAAETGSNDDPEVEPPRGVAQNRDLGYVRTRVSTLEVMAAARSSVAFTGQSIPSAGSSEQPNQGARASIAASAGSRRTQVSTKRSRTSLWCSALPIETLTAEPPDAQLQALQPMDDRDDLSRSQDESGQKSCELSSSRSTTTATATTTTAQRHPEAAPMQRGGTRQLSLNHQGTAMWSLTSEGPALPRKSVKFQADCVSGTEGDAASQMLQVPTLDASVSGPSNSTSRRQLSTSSSLWFENHTAAVSSSRSSPGSQRAVHVAASSLSTGTLTPVQTQSTRGSGTTHLLSHSYTCGGSLWTNAVGPKRSQSMALPSLGRSRTDTDMNSAGGEASGDVRPEGVARHRSSAPPRHVRVADGLRNERFQRSNRSGSVLSLTALALDKATSEGGALGHNLTSSEDLVTFEGCHDLLRGVELHRVLRRLGSIFKDSKGSQSTYDLSNVTTGIDQFLSHNWCVPWWKKFIALACYFNINLSIILTSVFVAVISLLCMMGYAPMVYPQNLEPFPSGYLLRVFTIPFFLLCLAFVRQLTDLFWFTRHLTFLDKVCINQVDPAIQKKGIEKLGAFIAKSKEMVVLYTDVYLIKLWTVYEVATHLAMKNVRTMKVVPVFKYGAWISCLITMYILELLTLVLRVLGPHMKHMKYYIAFVMGYIYMRFVLRKWARLRGKIRGRLRNFSVRECQCFCESDRSLVYSNIALLMEPVMKMENPERVVTQGEALEAFNLLVRKKLPGRFMSAFGRCTFTYREYVIIGLAAGGTADFDELGALAGGRPTKKVVVEFIRGIYQLFTIWPLIMIGMEMICEKCLTWRGWWDTGYTFVGMLGLSVPFAILNEIAKHVALRACECHPEDQVLHNEVKAGTHCEWDCGKAKLWLMVLVLMAALCPLIPLSLVMDGCCRRTRRRNISKDMPETDEEAFDGQAEESEVWAMDEDRVGEGLESEASPVFEVEELELAELPELGAAPQTGLELVELATIPGDPVAEDDQDICLGATDDMGDIHSISSVPPTTVNV